MDFTKWLALAKLTITLIPVLIQAIKQLEDAIPGQGKGEQKLAALRVILERAYSVTSQATVSFPELWRVIEPLVAVFVPVVTIDRLTKKGEAVN